MDRRFTERLLSFFRLFIPKANFEVLLKVQILYFLFNHFFYHRCLFLEQIFTHPPPRKDLRDRWWKFILHFFRKSFLSRLFISLYDPQPMNRLIQPFQRVPYTIPLLDNILSEQVQFCVLFARSFTDLFSGGSDPSIAVYFLEVFVVKFIFFIF